jgi:hypothetical protein
MAVFREVGTALGCLLALFAGIFPRPGPFIIWVARPKMVDAAFDSWIWPLLGFIFWTQPRQTPGYPSMA